MSGEPIDCFYGLTLSEYMEAFLDDLDDDVVGLWHIIPGFRRAFGMTDEAAIEKYTRQVLAKLLARGAHAVIGCSDEGGYWRHAVHYGDTPQSIIDAVIAEWKEKGVDPDIEDVWFILPEHYDQRRIFTP